MTSPVLYGQFRSSCCNAKQIIVRSRSKGFVTQNCAACEKPAYVRQHELPDHRFCLHCEVKLKIVDRRAVGYFYHCPRRHEETAVSEIVPHWSELFSYHGFGINSNNDDDSIIVVPAPRQPVDG